MKDTDIALQSENEPAMDERQVQEYLSKHTDFFQRNQDLLYELKLPHRTGKAISLVERQVSLLRDRTREGEKKLSELVSVARDNETLFEKTRTLTLALLDAGSLDELSQVLEDGFREDFHTDAGGLILLADADTGTSGNTRVMLHETLENDLPRFAELREATGGALREAEIDALFPLHERRIQSAMVAPVFLHGAAEGSRPRALLALGSADRGYFHDRLGTSFLEYIREVLGRILVDHLSDAE